MNGYSCNSKKKYFGTQNTNASLLCQKCLVFNEIIWYNRKGRECHAFTFSLSLDLSLSLGLSLNLGLSLGLNSET